MFPGGSEMLIILLVIVLLFGASRIPKVMKGLGEGMRSFKEGLEGKSGNEAAKSQDSNLVAVEKQLKGHVGKLVSYKNGVLSIGVSEGKKIVSIQDGLLLLEGEGVTETVKLTAIKEIIEHRS